MTDPIYKECMMCNLVEVGSVRVSHKAYLEAGGNPDEISHGVCKEQDCRTAYMMNLLGCSEEEALSELEEMTKDHK